jgi:hypothetical protein
MTLRPQAIVENTVPLGDTPPEVRSSPKARQSRRERNSSASRSSIAKTLLCAFGPLLFVAVLGLVGARIASVETRKDIASSDAGPHTTFARWRE